MSFKVRLFSWQLWHAAGDHWSVNYKYCFLCCTIYIFNRLGCVQNVSQKRFFGPTGVFQVGCLSCCRRGRWWIEPIFIVIDFLCGNKQQSMQYLTSYFCTCDEAIICLLLELWRYPDKCLALVLLILCCVITVDNSFHHSRTKFWAKPWSLLFSTELS